MPGRARICRDSPHTAGASSSVCRMLSGVHRPKQARSAARRVERSAATIATCATDRMRDTLPWFGSLPADQRSSVSLVVHAGVLAFAAWLRQDKGDLEMTEQVFSAAPQELAREVTLEQTVQMVRVTVDVVEEQVPQLAATGDEAGLREAVLRYSREIGFAAAAVYARAAEERGAWDARLEALVLDAMLREDADDNVMSQASALNWGSPGEVRVLVGAPPDEPADVTLTRLRRLARDRNIAVLAGVH